MPSLYNKIITGEWENFISINESRLFREAESKYRSDNKIDSFNVIENIDLKVLMSGPREEQFLNTLYLATQEIQALVWYREFLTEVMRDGITFYNDDHSDNEQKDKSKRKYIDIKNLQRTNNGYEAIKASFDEFVEKNDRIPKWPELMDYMARNPSHGVIVEASYKGSLVSELLIEGVEKPIDRDAFRNRYNRYFKKMDVK